MQKIILLLFAGVLLSAGCLTASEPPREAGMALITPAAPAPIFGGQATISEIVGREIPGVQTNYSLGYVVIPPGNATPPHRLLGSTEVVHVIGGVAEISCNNETVIIREGETVLLPEGALQSITSIGETDLSYLSAVQPPFTEEIEVLVDGPDPSNKMTDGAPLVIADPRGGIEWDLESQAAAYTLLNPVLMNETVIPIAYSIAYVELLPGRYLGFDGIRDSSDLLYVIEGEIEVATPDGGTIRIPAGSAAYIPPNVVKETRNTVNKTTVILSFIDPTWTPEKTGLWGWKPSFFTADSRRSAGLSAEHWQ